MLLSEMRIDLETWAVSEDVDASTFNILKRADKLG
jgi:hypothetical protein